MEKWHKWIEKHGKLLLGLGLTAYLILGLLLFRDYGTNYDELVQRQHSIITFNSVLGNTIQQNIDGITSLPDLSTYSGRFYGTVIQAPLVLIEYLRGFKMDTATVFRLRHLWTFLNCFLGSACFCLMLRRRFGTYRSALLGLCFLVLMPRTFADSFYNIKDAMFMAWIMIGLCVLSHLNEKAGLKTLLLFAAVSAVCVNIRVVGAILPALGVLLLLLRYPRKEIFRKVLLLCVATLGFYILFTPASWKNPIDHLLNCVSVFSDYSIATLQAILYCGKEYNISELPRHYLPVWIGVTTPLLYLVFFLGGILSFLCRVPGNFREKRKESLLDAAVLCVCVLPVLTAILKHSSLYNGWRHFYFIYPCMVYFMVFLLEKLAELRNPLPRIVCVLALMTAFCDTGLWMVKNHPHQMVYFNRLVRSRASELFERDYYSVTTAEALRFILDNDPNERITVWDADAGAAVHYWGLPKKDRERLVVNGLGNNLPADYIVLNYHHIIGNDASYPFYEPVFHIRADGMKLASVFQRRHEAELLGADIVTEAHSSWDGADLAAGFDGDRGSGWESGSNQKRGDFLELRLNGSYDLNGITFLQDIYGTAFPEHAAVECSADNGATWQRLTSGPRQGVDLSFEEARCNALRVSITADAERPLAFTELIFHGKPGDTE